jgi:hypothetical protein
VRLGEEKKERMKKRKDGAAVREGQKEGRIIL